MTVSDDLSDAMRIDCASAPNLRAGDSRRLTGPGLLWDRPGSVLEVEFEGFDPDRVVALWLGTARWLLDAVGWTQEAATARRFSGGAILAISAPVDLLYSATYVAQAVWHYAAASLLGQRGMAFAPLLDDLRAVMARETNLAWRSLDAAAAGRGIDRLVDEEVLTLGHGAKGKSFPISTLPQPSQVDWAALGNIPVALITGTNGKTTTTRLAAAIATAAGFVVGLTSTDFVKVGTRVLDRGDFSGPGGARMLLRDPAVEMAFLEVARGGILRRGLPLWQARAAAVLNVASDHLGEYGVNTVPDLAAAKFAVRRSLGAGGVMVLNADDPVVVAEALRQDCPAQWFSLTPDAPQLQRGNRAAWLDGTRMILSEDGRQTVLADATALPITMGGAARHNIANALAAALLTRALGVGLPAITAGLLAFRNDRDNNPGRGNLFAYRGAQVMVDFAHNPHSIAAVTAALAGFPSKRRFLMMSHAGDRSDDDIRGLARGAMAMRPDVIALAELPGYLRGRQTGDIPALFEAECVACGFDRNQILRALSPLEGARQILARLQPGDLALLLTHGDRDAIFALLQTG